VTLISGNGINDDGLIGNWRRLTHGRAAVVPTELVDLIDVRGGRISSHIEFFVPI